MTFKKNISVIAYLLLCASFHLFGQNVPDDFRLETVSSLENNMVGFDLLPDGRALVIGYQTGEVKLVVDGAIKSTVVKISDVKFSSEQGLLGIAVDPDFPDSNYVYLFHSLKDSVNEVARYTITGDLSDSSSTNLTIDPISKKSLIRAPDIQKFHNGGTLRFGPDKTLYISLGDDNRLGLIQDLTTLNGKILRINRDGSIPADNPVFPNEPAGKRAEIFAIGFRNPFRFDVDMQTGELFIGDVGLKQKEEVDISVGGENFGWPKFEGTVTFRDCTLIAPTPIGPVTEYDNVGANVSVMALASYRQQNYPNDNSFPNEYEGALFYADFYGGPIKYLLKDTADNWTIHNFATGFEKPVDGRVGPDGSLYILEFGKSLKKISFNSAMSVDDDLMAYLPAGKRFLHQNNPNPFSSTTKIEFNIPDLPFKDSDFRMTNLSVYNAIGQKVATLVDGIKPPGTYTLHWDGTGDGKETVPAGIYYYRLSYGPYKQTKKMVLIKD